MDQSISSDQCAIVRTPLEVQRAHDLLTGLLLDDRLRALVSKDTEHALIAAADALCWLLGHEHNRNFEQNLEAIELAMRRLGVELVDSGELQKG